MGGFSFVHWIILALVILLLFGGNRFSAMMGDVAKGLKSFKQGMADEDDRGRIPPPQYPPQGLPPQQSTPPRQHEGYPPQQPADAPPPTPAAEPSAPPPPPAAPSDDSAR